MEDLIVVYLKIVIVVFTFALFLLGIALSVLLRFMDSDYPFGIVKLFFMGIIRVITKLPNSEQSYKGKVKTHNYINRQNQSTTGKL